MAKNQQFKISKTLKRVGNWLISDNLPKVVIINPPSEFAANLNAALANLEDSRKIINNPR